MYFYICPYVPDESGGRCDYGIRLLVVLRDDGDELHDVGHVLLHEGQLRRDDGRVGECDDGDGEVVAARAEHALGPNLRGVNKSCEKCIPDF